MAYRGWGWEKSFLINCRCVLNADWILLVMLLCQAHWNMFIQRDICMWLSCRYLAHLGCCLALQSGASQALLHYSVFKKRCAATTIKSIKYYAWFWLSFRFLLVLWWVADIIALVVWPNQPILTLFFNKCMTWWTTIPPLKLKTYINQLFSVSRHFQYSK